MRIRTSPAVAGFLSTLFAVALILGPMQNIALAVDCDVLGTSFLGYADHQATQQWGVQLAKNSVINPNSDCSIVRSTYVWDSINNLVEVGWYENGSDGALQKCDYVLTPHILVYAIVNGFVKCKSGTAALNAGLDYSFRVANPDHDSDFVYEWDDDNTPSINLGFYATDHTNGYPKTASERHHTNDSLRADFTGMDSLGGGGAWGPYPNPQPIANNSVGYVICSSGSTFFHIRAIGGCS